MAQGPDGRGTRGVNAATQTSELPLQPPDLASALLSCLIKVDRGRDQECNDKPGSAPLPSNGGKVESERDLPQQASSFHSQYRLAYLPPHVVHRRGRWFPNDAPAGLCSEDVWEVISAEDWVSLVEVYANDGARGQDSLPLGYHGIEAQFVVDSSAPRERSAWAEDRRDLTTESASGEESSDKISYEMEKTTAPDAMQQSEEHVNLIDTDADAHDEKTAEDFNHRTSRAERKSSMRDVNGCHAHSNGSIDVNSADEVSPSTKSQHGKLQRQNIASGHRMTTFRGSDMVGRFVTQPPVCLKTVQARCQALRAAQLTYVDQEVMVEIVSTEEEARTGSLSHGVRAPPSSASVAESVYGLPQAPATTQEYAIRERKSRRSRKNRAPVAVDSTTTVADLKLRIFEALGVHPWNAQLFIRGSDMEEIALDLWRKNRWELQNDVQGENRHDGSDATWQSKETRDSFCGDLTMRDLEVFPGEELRIIDSKVHDADDVSDLFAFSMKNCSQGKTSRRPEGFGGTALSGFAAPSSAC